MQKSNIIWIKLGARSCKKIHINSCIPMSLKVVAYGVSPHLNLNECTFFMWRKTIYWVCLLNEFCIYCSEGFCATYLCQLITKKCMRHSMWFLQMTMDKEKVYEVKVMLGLRMGLCCETMDGVCWEAFQAGESNVVDFKGGGLIQKWR